MARKVCGATHCEREADVLVHSMVLLNVKKLPRCMKHLSKFDNYEVIPKGRVKK